MFLLEAYVYFFCYFISRPPTRNLLLAALGSVSYRVRLGSVFFLNFFLYYWFVMNLRDVLS